MELNTVRSWLSLISMALIYFSVILTVVNAVAFSIVKLQSWKQVLVVDGVAVLLGLVPIGAGFIRFIPAA